ncbi:MAG: cation:proton antiporter [Thermoleophilaceae bacterium]
MSEDPLILAAGVLLAVGVAASLLAARVRVPGLVLFLALGMVVGSDVTGLVPFADYEVARTIGVIALALILFEGGLSAGLREIRPVLGPATSLAVVGTLITAVITGLGAAFLLDLSPLEGLLLGAVLCPTDSAAIFALLRGSSLRRRLARTLEGESGLNDPVAVLLVLGFIEWLLTARLRARGHGHPLRAGAGGRAAGGNWRGVGGPGGGPPGRPTHAWAVSRAVAGRRGARLRPRRHPRGLGLPVRVPHRPHPRHRHHSGAARGRRIPRGPGMGGPAHDVLHPRAARLPQRAARHRARGAAVALLLALVARPLAVAVSTLPFGYAPREQLLLGWAGLRGAVPVVLATFPVIAEVPGSGEYFNIVFFAVLFSTVLQGATFEPIARRLRLTSSEPALPRPLTESGTIQRLGAEVLEFPVGPEDAAVGARIRDLGLPREAVVNVIVQERTRRSRPRGSTRVAAGDQLHVLTRRESAQEVRDLLDRWRSGPIGRPARAVAAPGSSTSTFSSWRWREADGDAAHPETVRGQPIVEALRVRRDRPGGLYVVADGRYAIIGAVAALGRRRQLSAWARRRASTADPDERAWLQTVIGALATDPYE